VFDRIDRNVLYLGSQDLLATRDGGVHCDTLSHDLSRMRPGTQPPKGMVTVAEAGPLGYGVIYTIAPSPIARGVIWTGTDDGLIHVTRDAGKTWQRVTPPGVAPWSQISLIDASPLDSGGAYAAVDRHRLDDYGPYIYRTKDFGKTWSRADNGIPAPAYVHVVRADPVRRGLLYAGTELGPYISFDDGDHWQPLQLNLPITPIHDLAVHETDLVAATHGRSFWVLDDLSPLRSVRAPALAARATLVPPARAYRVRRNENRDTPISPEEPQGENPPTGAIIDYYLGAAPSTPVVIEILDGKETVIRREASNEPFKPPTPREPLQIAPYWLPTAAPPTARAGHNRFVWDLRYPLPPADQYGYTMGTTANQRSTLDPLGPLVLPGKYTVRLTVGDSSYTRSLDVVQDPRVHVTDAELRGQLALAIDVWNAMAEQTALHQTATSLVTQLRALPGNALDEKTRASAGALEKKATELANATTSDDLGALLNTVGSGDGEATEPSRIALTTLRTRYDQAKTQWAAIQRTDLPALNAALAKKKLPAIQIGTRPAARLAAPS